jgi:hypothetical protein
MAFHVPPDQRILGPQYPWQMLRLQSCVPCRRSNECCDRCSDASFTNLGSETSSSSEETENWDYSHSHDGFVVSVVVRQIFVPSLITIVSAL